MSSGVPAPEPRELGNEAKPAPAVNLAELYKAQFHYVWRTLRRLGVPERDLPDLTHDFFEIVQRQLPTYDRTRPVKPWLFGIAFRVVSDYRRSSPVSREVLDGFEHPEMADQRPGADEHVAEAQGRALLMSVLDSLDLDRRAVLVMHDLDEQSGPEIAAALGIPLPTVHSRLRLARADFAAAMKRLRATEERKR